MTSVNTEARTPVTSSEAVADRVKWLMENDAQFRGALALPEINDAKMNPALGLAEVVATCMQGYAERPALGERAFELVKDATTGRTERKLLNRYETVSYAYVWGKAQALASFWQQPEHALGADEMICMIAFAGIDFVTTDLAAIHNGAVVVPLQTNAQLPQLINIVKEVEPRWIASSVECLDTAVDLILQGHRPQGVLVFDYNPAVDAERERFTAAQERLSKEGLAGLLLTLDQACEKGKTFGKPELYVKESIDKRLCTLYYTSGSTGMPKGAMVPESMLKPNWRVIAPVPFIYIHYMPMNHSFGRSGVFFTLGSGGTCYFTAKSDLSELFNDIKLVRPTLTGIVPRICEMVYQQYQSEFERRSPDASDLDGLKATIELELRNDLLGGRLLSGSFGSAPLAPELRAFMDSCLGFKMDEFYGATEVSGVLFNGHVMSPPVIDYKLIDVPELGYYVTDKPYPRGELLIKTHSIMLGYYKRPEVTASVFDQDGYYMTGDIMAQVGANQLSYLDRRNNVIKLSQGEFVAIAHLESLFTNGHSLIRQAYLYGSSERAFLLGVLVPNESVVEELGLTDASALKEALREAIKDVAKAEDLHAYEVPRDFIVEHEAFSVENGLLAGIGKYQRPKFKERYGASLEEVYESIAANQAGELQALRRDGANLPVEQILIRVVQANLGIEITEQALQDSFKALGGDSMTALSCSALLEDIYQQDIPVSVINNPSGTLQQVVQYIERTRSGEVQRVSCSSVHGRGATQIKAADLTLDKFMSADELDQATKLASVVEQPRGVLVTGANGYLGRFLCLDWLERMAKVDGQVICIARGQSAQAARERIAEVFDSGDAALKARFDELANKHLLVMAGDLGEANLGLSDEDWQYLTEKVDVIVHPAAFVNHVLPYAQLFEANVLGTAELIRLSLSHHLKPFHYVSTMAAAMTPDGTVLDETADVRTATPVRVLDEKLYANGYGNSKWAGEVLLREAYEQFGLPVAVFRSDMILAHSHFAGQINVPDMFTRWLSSIVLTGLAPRSFYPEGEGEPHYDGLPADFTSKAITEIGARLKEGFHNYHVINDHEDGISMDTFIDWVIDAGYPVERLDSYEIWHQRFGTALRALPDKQRQQSFLPLLHQLNQPMPRTLGALVSCAHFSQAVEQAGIAGGIPHLSKGLIEKYLSDFKQVGLL